MIITHVIADDWYGLYADDELICEGHSFDIDDLPTVLAAIGTNSVDVVQEEVDYEWAEDTIFVMGRMPEKLQRVKLG